MESIQSFFSMKVARLNGDESLPQVSIFLIRPQRTEGYSQRPRPLDEPPAMDSGGFEPTVSEASKLANLRNPMSGSFCATFCTVSCTRSPL